MSIVGRLPTLQSVHYPRFNCIFSVKTLYSSFVSSTILKFAHSHYSSTKDLAYVYVATSGQVIGCVLQCPEGLSDLSSLGDPAL